MKLILCLIAWAWSGLARAEDPPAATVTATPPPKLAEVHVRAEVTSEPVVRPSPALDSLHLMDPLLKTGRPPDSDLLDTLALMGNEAPPQLREHDLVRPWLSVVRQQPVVVYRPQGVHEPGAQGSLEILDDTSRSLAAVVGPRALPEGKEAATFAWDGFVQTRGNAPPRPLRLAKPYSFRFRLAVPGGSRERIGYRSTGLTFPALLLPQEAPRRWEVRLSREILRATDRLANDARDDVLGLIRMEGADALRGHLRIVPVAPDSDPTVEEDARQFAQRLSRRMGWLTTGLPDWSLVGVGGSPVASTALPGPAPTEDAAPGFEIAPPEQDPDFPSDCYVRLYIPRSR